MTKKRRLFIAPNGQSFFPARFKEHPYYQPPIPGETREQGMRRRELNPVKWTDHVPGQQPDQLGPDYEVVLAEMIEERLQELHDASNHSKQAITEFLMIEPDFRKNAWLTLQKFEQRQTLYRLNHEMTPFNWALETRETVTAALGFNKGKATFPRTIEYRELLASRAREAQNTYGQTVFDVLKRQNLDEARRMFAVSDSENHPLQKNQVKRNPDKVGHSPHVVEILEKWNREHPDKLIPIHPRKENE